MKILIIEDDASIVRVVSRALEAQWSEAELLSASEGGEGIEIAKVASPDIVILDLMLPDQNGFEVLQQIRVFSDVLLLIVTAKGEEDSRIRGLQEGADDYIVKPFSAGELVARMKSLVRRREIVSTESVAALKSANSKKLIIDTAMEKASIGGKLLNMGPRQYEMLCLLVTSAGEVVSKKEIMRKIFPENDANDTRFVDVYVKKLREELGEYPESPRMIINEGDGYKFTSSYVMMREALRELDY